MDTQPEKSPGLGLPQPLTEKGSANSGSHHNTHGREIRPITMEPAPASTRTPAGAATTPLPLVVQQPMPIIPVAAPDDSVASMAGASTDDNSDALDEEWVNKAKAIVERTKSDPYTESRELSKAKADYLRLRYNKQLKVAEERH